MGSEMCIRDRLCAKQMMMEGAAGVLVCTATASSERHDGAAWSRACSHAREQKTGKGEQEFLSRLDALPPALLVQSWCRTCLQAACTTRAWPIRQAHLEEAGDAAYRGNGRTVVLESKTVMPHPLADCGTTWWPACCFCTRSLLRARNPGCVGSVLLSASDPFRR